MVQRIAAIAIVATANLCSLVLALSTVKGEVGERFGGDKFLHLAEL